MKSFLRRFGAVLILCILLVANGGAVSAQQGLGSQYFADTGHNVSGDFWTYYQGAAAPELIFGSPITEQFTDLKTGRIIQYFQRARFEYYPENPSGQRVILAPLGLYIYQHTKPAPAVENFTPIGCRYYADTGLSLCYAFLDYFDRNGGEAVFGRPTSPFVFNNGRIVQYFERVRFEWFPEYPEGQKVILAELGRIYFDLVPEDANRLQPVKADNAPGEVQALRARAFTLKAVTLINDEQSVYVVAQDQTLKPVAGATAIVTITWQQGGTQTFALTTNSSGVAPIPLQVQDQPHGSLVLVDVEILYNGLSKKTQTSFRVW